jgi:arylsulfatase A-like enzyme
MWLLPLAIAGNAYAATDKPNVIILLGDDVGYEAFGCTGNTYAKTPHIDELASEGLVFDRFYLFVCV